MKRIKITFLALVASTLLITSCGNSTVYPQNEDGGKAVKQIIEKNFDPEKQVEELQIKSKEELYGELGEVKVVYWDGDKQMEDIYSPADGVQKSKESFASEKKMPFLKKTKTVAIKSFDVAPIPFKVGEATTLIPQEYENYSLHEYTFSVDDNGKVKQLFAVNATKKGEGKSQQGRMVSQNYYTFKFTVDENGKVALIP